MTLKEFLDMYDNWNGLLTINDDYLMRKIGNTALYSRVRINQFMEVHGKDHLMEAKVIAFGFYDEELCIRVKQ